MSPLSLVLTGLIAAASPSSAGAPSAAASSAAGAFSRGETVDAAFELARRVQDARPPVDPAEFERQVRAAARSLSLDAAGEEAAVVFYAARLKTFAPSGSAGRAGPAPTGRDTRLPPARSAAVTRDARGMARALSESRGDAGSVPSGSAGVTVPASSAGRSEAEMRKPAAQPQKLSRPVVPPAPAGGPAQVPGFVEASHRLINHYGDPSLALQVVINARGGDAKEVSPRDREAARAELAGVLSVPPAAVDPTMLARLDHFLNTYGAVRYEALDPKAGDGWVTRKSRTFGRAIFGTVALGVALGYESVKAVDQTTGARFGVWLPKMIGREGYDFHDNASKASWGGVGAKISGAWYGVFDEEPNAPARR